MMTEGMLALALALAVCFYVLILRGVVWLQEKAKLKEAAKAKAKAEAEEEEEARKAEKEAWETARMEDLVERWEESKVHLVRDLCDFAETWDGRHRTAVERMEALEGGPLWGVPLWDVCSFMEVREGRYLTAAERMAMRWAMENWKARRDAELGVGQNAQESVRRKREIRKAVEIAMGVREARREARRNERRQRQRQKRKQKQKQRQKHGKR